MSLETKQVKDVLGNIDVLIVEDDDELADRIARLFNEYTSKWPEIAGSAAQARKAMDDHQGDFGLAIIDTMLPSTEDDVKAIKGCEKTLAQVRKKIETAGTRPKDDASQMFLSTARYERSLILRQIEELIDQEAGIKLVEEWRRAGQHVPVLFLTAVGNDKMIQRGRLLAGELSDWITKPAHTYLIIEKSVELLSRDRSKGERRL